MERHELEYHIESLERLVEVIIEPLGEDGRWKVFDALLNARGFECMERTIGPNGTKCRIPDLYLDSLKAVLAFSRERLSDLEPGKVNTVEILPLKVPSDEERTADAVRSP